MNSSIMFTDQMSYYSQKSKNLLKLPTMRKMS